MLRLTIKVFINLDAFAQNKRVLERIVNIPKDNHLDFLEITRVLHLLFGDKAVILFEIYNI